MLCTQKLSVPVCRTRDFSLGYSQSGTECSIAVAVQNSIPILKTSYEPQWCVSYLIIYVWGARCKLVFSIQNFSPVKPVPVLIFERTKKSDLCFCYSPMIFNIGYAVFPVPNIFAISWNMCTLFLNFWNCDLSLLLQFRGRISSYSTL